VLLFFIGGSFVLLQAMPPKVFRKEVTEKNTTTERTEEQGRRITDSDDDDLSSEEERGIIIGAKEEVKNDEILVEAFREEVMDLKENFTPLLFASFKEALAKNPQAKRFILNSTKDAIYASEEMQSTSIKLAENRTIAEYLGKLWVGPNYTTSPICLESKDGLKRYRFPSPKFKGLSSRADTGFQSNFDWRADNTVDWSLTPGELKRQNANWGDGHLDVLY